MRLVGRLVDGIRAGLAGVERLVGEFGDGEAVGELQRRLDGIGQARAEVGAHDDAVDDDVDVVLVLLVERRRVGDLVEGAVDLDALEALLLQLGEFLAVLALAAAHDRREDDRGACLRRAPARGRPSG